ncbi:exopolysaccharide biosynthesis polyprenyl glycosylphosphotransferase [Prosthecomicrobium sp. N25]|uniref:exopolysaccharide biosynthesis polyprenyl glycosylphosphotransferase n=1 Tax=Prosthecomicrobium sp. N25 TaxID=3129254 RepID=UPI003077C5CE
MSDIPRPDLPFSSRAGESSPLPKLRLRAELLQCLLLASDLVLIGAAGLVLAALLSGQPDVQDDLWSVFCTVALIFPAAMLAKGGYRLDGLPDAGHQIRHTARAWLVAFGIAAWAAFLLKIGSSYSRVAVLSYFTLGGVTLVAWHLAVSVWLRRRIDAGLVSLRRAVVVAIAEPSEYDHHRRVLVDRGIEVVAAHLIAPNLGTVSVEALRACQTVRAALAATRCDLIMVFAPWSDQRQAGELLAALAPLPLPVLLMADKPAGRILRQNRLRFGPLFGFEMQRAPLDRTDRAAKRLLDLTVASLALLILSPLLVLTGFAILLETGRPILFRQHRRGFGGRRFEILKFRSMTVQENGPTVLQAQRGDPRVTRLGRLLRKTSVDELPQLVNVLRGEMSICGPRPHAIAHDNQYEELIATYAYRHHVKPGITGWAQVNGLRGETRDVALMEARVDHDLWYINNWSIWLDLRIIVMTALKVVNDRQAY